MKRREPAERDPADFTVTHHGSVSLLAPRSMAAKEWVRENLEVEQVQMFGESVAVGGHYIDAIVDGIRLAGMEVA